MALTRVQKEELVKLYQSDIQNCKNLIILRQFGLPANEANKLRKEVKEAGGKISVLKKRVFLKCISESNLETITLDMLQ